MIQVPFSILVWGSYKGLPFTMACYVLVVWTMQAHAQYLHIGAGIVFGITQQCDFHCVLVLRTWENLEIFRLTDNPSAAGYLYIPNDNNHDCHAKPLYQWT